MKFNIMIKAGGLVTPVHNAEFPSSMEAMDWALEQGGPEAKITVEPVKEKKDESTSTEGR